MHYRFLEKVFGMQRHNVRPAARMAPFRVGGFCLLSLCCLQAPSLLLAQTTTVPYEAEASGNTLSGTTAVAKCSTCSNGEQVTGIGGSSRNYLIVKNIRALQTGQALVGIYYTENGTATLYVSANGSAGASYSLTGTSTTTPVYRDILVNLNAGSNSIKLYNNSAVAPNVDRIVVTLGGADWGLLSNGDRDKYSWPFYRTSPLNMPIGSGAVYQAAGITSNDGGGYTTFFYPDENVEIMTPTAPSTQLNYSDVGWDGGSRCPATGGEVGTILMPSWYTIPNGTGNNSTASLESDGVTVDQNQPLTRCTAGAAGTTLVVFPTVNIYSSDTSGAHGGSGLSALGTPVRLGEFLSGKIHHPMSVALWAQQYYYCCTYHWPATTVDSYADSTTYGGTNPNFGPGTLLALPPSFDVSSLTTVPGKIIAQAFIDYGAYVNDDVGANGWAFDTETGPNGSVAEEFQTLYGYSIDHPATGSAFMNDMVTIFQALDIVTNNSSSNVGGGGTPLVPIAPDIGN